MGQLINIAIRHMSEDKEDLCHLCGEPAGLSYYPDYEKNICAHCAKKCESWVGIHDGDETECGKEVAVWWKGKGFCEKHVPQAYKDFKKSQEITDLRATIQTLTQERDAAHNAAIEAAKGVVKRLANRKARLLTADAMIEIDALKR